MTNPTIQRATESAVRARGYHPGTTLENSVILILARTRAAGFCQQHQVGRYRLDFAWPAKKIALEADGWYHRSPEGAAKDRTRDSWLRSRGWLVLRVDDEHGEHLLQEQVYRVALIVSQHPDTWQDAPRRKRDGCAADVTDYGYYGDKRPCSNKRRTGSPYCYIHRSLSA